MSYEYKDEIIEDIKARCKSQNKNIAVYPVYHYEDKVEELNHVYARAAKADEYEAKAKAWDAMKKDFEDIADTPMGQQILFNMSIIKERVERRDSNA